MFSKSNFALSAAIALGVLGASPAWALHDHFPYGGPVQTWCDVNPDCNGWNKRLRSPSNEASASGFVTTQKHRPSRKHSHEADNRY